jgi:hypothetical protein
MLDGGGERIATLMSSVSVLSAAAGWVTTWREGHRGAMAKNRRKEGVRLVSFLPVE